MNDHHDVIDAFFDLAALPILLLVFLFSLLAAIFKRWRLKYNSPDQTKTPVLLSYYTYGNNLISADKYELSDVKGGASCIRMVTIPREKFLEDRINIQPGTPLLFVELPFRSKLHLLAITTGGKFDQLNPTYGDTVMQKAILEGDFHDYFSLYIDEGEQIQLRYVFDPSAMAYVIDFCHKYQWEIIDDVIYFAGDNELPDDPTIKEFIRQIRPALENKSTLPLFRYKYRKPLWPKQSKYKCPLCNERMTEYRYWHECKKGHGQLIRGGSLISIKEKQNILNEDINSSNLPINHPVISCPVCSNKMSPSNYGGSKIVIDVCSHCQYRWLDVGELKNILHGTNRV